VLDAELIILLSQSLLLNPPKKKEPVTQLLKSLS